MIESDCKKAIDIILNRASHFGLHNWIREIHWWITKFEGVKFQWILREANRVVDRLATEQQQLSLSFSFHFMYQCQYHLYYMQTVDSQYHLSK